MGGSGGEWEGCSKLPKKIHVVLNCPLSHHMKDKDIHVFKEFKRTRDAVRALHFSPNVPHGNIFYHKYSKFHFLLSHPPHFPHIKIVNRLFT